MFAIQRPMSVTSQVSNWSENSHTEKQQLEGNLRLLDVIECNQGAKDVNVMCCKFNADGTRLAVGLSDGTIKVYDTKDCRCLHSLQDDDTRSNNHQLPVTQIQFRQYKQGEKIEYSNILMASYASGHVKFWHYTSEKCLHTISETSDILTIANNMDGSRFLTAGKGSQVHVYDEETKKIVSILEPSDSPTVMDGHMSRIFSSQYHPLNLNVFITGGWDDTVQFWDDRIKHSVRRISGPHICGDAIDIDPVHNHILTGSWRKHKVLQIWDFSQAKSIKDIPEDPLFNSMVYCCQWVGKDGIVCGGSDANMARIIDRGTLNTTGQLVDLPNAVYCVDNDRQGHHPKIAIGTGSVVSLVRNEKRT